jgi:tetratricopeptide (TPR) repeat protein
VLSAEEIRAWSLFNRGKVPESEKVFRALVSSYSITAVEQSTKEFANLSCGLAIALSEMGRKEEATVWFEKSWQVRISSFGANHFASIATCFGLANCYEAQGRFEDVLKTYRQMIDKIRDAHEDPNERIAELELEANRIEDLLARDLTAVVTVRS